MRNADSVKENEMYKFLWDFDIQTRLSNGQQKKITCRIGNFAGLMDYELKIRASEKESKVPRPCQRTKKKKL